MSVQRKTELHHQTRIQALGAAFTSPTFSRMKLLVDFTGIVVMSVTATALANLDRFESHSRAVTATNGGDTWSSPGFVLNGVFRLDSRPAAKTCIRVVQGTPVRRANLVARDSALEHTLATSTDSKSLVPPLKSTSEAPSRLRDDHSRRQTSTQSDLRPSAVHQMKKRQAELATVLVSANPSQTLVLQLAVEVVTQPVQRVTNLIVAETRATGFRPRGTAAPTPGYYWNATRPTGGYYGSGTRPTGTYNGSGTRPASVASLQYRPWATGATGSPRGTAAAATGGSYGYGYGYGNGTQAAAASTASLRYRPGATGPAVSPSGYRA